MRRTESSLGAGGLLDMQRTDSEIGADGLLDILYSSYQPMGDEPLLDALDKGKHEWSRNEEAVQRRDSSEHHHLAKAPRIASAEAGRGSLDIGRGSVDMVLPPAGASVGSSSAEAQARMPTDLPVSLHSPLLSWPSARLPVPMTPPSSSSSIAPTTTAAAGVAKGASLPNSPGLSPALLYALAADVDLPPFTLQPSNAAEHPTSMPLGDLLESQAAPPTGWRPSPRSQAPPEFTESFLQEHARWQEALRAALSHADGYTRSLVGAAAAYSPYGTIRVIARLSPRQIEALHPPARELVQRLLDVTRAHASLDHASLDFGRPPATSRNLGRPPATSRDLGRSPATSRDLPPLEGAQPARAAHSLGVSTQVRVS